MQKDSSTEQRIKEAARKVFMEKGYGLARTRDIAQAAGINTALLNYYFRNKEKLFNIIIAESVREMFSEVVQIIENSHTSLSYKIEAIVNRYAEVFSVSPNLPLFVFSELQSQPELFFQKVGIPQNILLKSHFFRQLEDHLKKMDIKVQPLHIFINIIAMTVLPVIARPIMTRVHAMDQPHVCAFIQERRTLIPIWIKEMIKLNEEI